MSFIFIFYFFYRKRLFIKEKESHVDVAKAGTGRGGGGHSGIAQIESELTTEPQGEGLFFIVLLRVVLFFCFLKRTILQMLVQTYILFLLTTTLILINFTSRIFKTFYEQVTWAMLFSSFIFVYIEYMNWMVL